VGLHVAEWRDCLGDPHSIAWSGRSVNSQNCDRNHKIVT
jgi:hypothetical protein